MEESLLQDLTRDEAVLAAVLVTCTVAGGVLLGGVIAVDVCARAAWRRLRVAALGGVTTLRQDLGVDCPMCRHGMVAGDVVRELSCGHVFHKACEYSVDRWLRDNGLACPVCRRIARSVRALRWMRWFNAQPPQPEEEMMVMDLEGQEDWMPPPPEEQNPPPPGAGGAAAAPAAAVDFVVELGDLPVPP